MLCQLEHALHAQQQHQTGRRRVQAGPGRDDVGGGGSGGRRAEASRADVARRGAGAFHQVPALKEHIAGNIDRLVTLRGRLARPGGFAAALSELAAWCMDRQSLSAPYFYEFFQCLLEARLGAEGVALPLVARCHACFESCMRFESIMPPNMAQHVGLWIQELILLQLVRERGSGSSAGAPPRKRARGKHTADAGSTQQHPPGTSADGAPGISPSSGVDVGSSTPSATPGATSTGSSSGAGTATAAAACREPVGPALVGPVAMEHGAAEHNVAFTLPDEVNALLGSRGDLGLYLVLAPKGRGSNEPPFAVATSEATEPLLAAPTCSCTWPGALEARLNDRGLHLGHGTGAAAGAGGPALLPTAGLLTGFNVLSLKAKACICNLVVSVRMFQSLSVAAVEAVSRQRGVGLAPKRPVQNKRQSLRVSVAGAQEVSLMCPLSDTRIQTPVRGQRCRHHQCVDLAAFLRWASDQGSEWVCPICTEPMPSSIVVWDETFASLLATSPATARTAKFARGRRPGSTKGGDGGDSSGCHEREAGARGDSSDAVEGGDGGTQKDRGGRPAAQAVGSALGAPLAPLAPLAPAFEETIVDVRMRRATQLGLTSGAEWQAHVKASEDARLGTPKKEPASAPPVGGSPSPPPLQHPALAAAPAGPASDDAFFRGTPPPPPLEEEE